MTDNDPAPEFAEFQAMLVEIVGQTDRAAAIVAFAYLDEMLTEAVQSHLHDFKHKGENIRQTLFKGAGPLATFSARRRLAYLLGLFGPKTYADLGRLAQIRNEFAHTRSVRTFKSQRIKNLCGALTTPIFDEFEPRFENLLSDPRFSKTRVAYVNTIMLLCGTLRGVSQYSLPPPHKHRLLP